MGESIPRPDEPTMRALLASVSVCDAEHPDVALEHESGWALSYFASHTITFENVEAASDAGPWHMDMVTLEQALELWILLASGQIAAVQEQAWMDGYA